MISSLLFILGLVFGSFVSAFTYRYPKGISTAKGRSFCPKCKAKIAWFDNIPLLSFLLLGGKCRKCNKQISLRYPGIELATAIGFLIIGFNAAGLMLFLILESIFIIDLENQIIPDFLVFLGLLISLFTIHYSPFTGLLSAFLSADFLLLIHLATSGRGMGLGDVKFALLGGFVLGYPLFLVWLFLSFLTGAVVGVILMLIKGFKLKDKIAFGPFLAVSLIIVYIWGGNLIKLMSPR